MRIQLIHPPTYVHPRAMTALRPAPPLGLAYIAGTLLRAGHTVSVLDAIAAAPEQFVEDRRLLRLGLTTKEIVARIDPEAEALGITSLFSFTWPLVREMLHAIKAAHPEKIIMCGGEHFTALPERSMAEAPIDYIVMGEGEEIAKQLFGKLASGEPFDPNLLFGVCWRDGDRIVKNPRAVRMKAVDQIPWPAWELFDLAGYDDNSYITGLRLGRTVPILATRGCPYQCTYCSSPRMWTQRWQPRSPIDVVNEIEHYHKTFGATNFPFQDLTAIIRKQWILDFCNELLARDLDIRWQLPAGTRCEVVDDEVAPLLWKSGCRAMAFAPESGSERTRQLIKKKMKTDDLMAAIDATVKHEISLTAFIVIAFPHDTAEDLKETVRMVRQFARRGMTDVGVGFFFPLPATELYDDLQEKGRIQMGDEFLMTPIYANDWWLTDDRNYCEHISSRALTFWKFRILLNFYALKIAVQPRWLWQRVTNLFRDRETSKFDAFLLEKKRVFRRFMKRFSFGVGE